MEVSLMRRQRCGNEVGRAARVRLGAGRAFGELPLLELDREGAKIAWRRRGYSHSPPLHSHIPILFMRTKGDYCHHLKGLDQFGSMASVGGRDVGIDSSLSLRNQSIQFRVRTLSQASSWSHQSPPSTTPLALFRPLVVHRRAGKVDQRSEQRGDDRSNVETLEGSARLVEEVAGLGEAG